MNGVILRMNGLVVRKVKDAQPAGEYRPTAVDAVKGAAAFQLLQVGPNIIEWKDGKRERVTDRQLARLQQDHPSWTTDF